MELENMYIQMDQYMKENGKKINKTEQEKKLGLMELVILGIINLVKNQAMENLNGPMALCMKVNF